MTEDPDNDGGGDSPRPRRNRDTGDGGSALLSLLLFAFRYPKLSLALLLIGGTYMYCSDGPAPDASQPVVADAPRPSSGRLGTGATLDPKVYDEALVYEPLAGGGKNALPERVSLLEYAPRRLSQGAQGSCVGWATSYAARTILYAKQTGKPPDDVAFSPAFLYNQIALDNCQGTYLKRAMEVLERTGDLPLGDFAYDPRTCERRPSSSEKSRAGAFRIAGYTRLSIDADDYRTNAEALKQNLAQGAPVVIGMRVGGSFESGMQGKKLWRPTKSDYAEVESWGGHAMAVIGYDDTLEDGAFQLMNSWGDDWGEGGVAWVRYRDFDHFVKEAYGLYPMGSAKRESQEQRIRFGLVGAQDYKRLALNRVDELTYRTASPIRKGSRFKVEFANSRPVYTYLFGQETDGSSYVLFPYTEKHSPYCGTTGTRIFPRKQSLTADELGSRDSIAVVISPKPLDFKALNERITSQSGTGYAAKLRGALGASLDSGGQARTREQLVELVSAQTDPDKVHALVIEFDKR
jgi:hypothetical protein